MYAWFCFQHVHYEIWENQLQLYELFQMNQSFTAAAGGHPKPFLKVLPLIGRFVDFQGQGNPIFTFVTVAAVNRLLWFKEENGSFTSSLCTIKICRPGSWLTFRPQQTRIRKRREGKGERIQEAHFGNLPLHLQKERKANRKKQQKRRTKKTPIKPSVLVKARCSQLSQVSMFLHMPGSRLKRKKSI